MELIYEREQTFVLNLAVAIGIYGLDYVLEHLIGIFQGWEIRVSESLVRGHSQAAVAAGAATGKSRSYY